MSTLFVKKVNQWSQRSQLHNHHHWLGENDSVQSDEIFMVQSVHGFHLFDKVSEHPRLSQSILFKNLGCNGKNSSRRSSPFPSLYYTKRTIAQFSCKNRTTPLFNKSPDCFSLIHQLPSKDMSRLWIRHVKAWFWNDESKSLCLLFLVAPNLERESSECVDVRNNMVLSKWDRPLSSILHIVTRLCS